MVWWAHIIEIFTWVAISSIALVGLGLWFESFLDGFDTKEDTN